MPSWVCSERSVALRFPSWSPSREGNHTGDLMEIMGVMNCKGVEEREPRSTCVCYGGLSPLHHNWRLSQACWPLHNIFPLFPQFSIFCLVAFPQVFLKQTRAGGGLEKTHWREISTCVLCVFFMCVMFVCPFWNKRLTSTGRLGLTGMERTGRWGMGYG